MTPRAWVLVCVLYLQIAYLTYSNHSVIACSYDPMRCVLAALAWPAHWAKWLLALLF
jgi:hypothetical protein